MTPAQLIAVQKLAPLAVAIEKTTQCPAWLIVGQVCLESGYLLREAGANNFLGVKWFPGVFGFRLCDTWEVFTDAQLQEFLKSTNVPEQPSRRAAVAAGPSNANGSRPYKCKDYFASFASLADCLQWRANRFHGGINLPWVLRYLKDPGSRDSKLKLAHDVVALGHYATADPDVYAASVVGIGDSIEARFAINAALNPGKVVS